jgi:KaiC/GvpD/RAD55 family RecA-like ATPase
MVKEMIKPLPIEEYRKVYDTEKVVCPSTDKLKPTDEIIGQGRAQKALRFGLNIVERGFNIYVAGIPGTGRKTAVRKFLDELARTKPKANDWIYVNNFNNQYEPIAIELSPGKGTEFKHDMSAFIEEARRALPKAFESEDYASKRQEALENIEREKAKIIQQINKSAENQGFVIQMGPTGLEMGSPCPKRTSMRCLTRSRKKSRRIERSSTPNFAMRSASCRSWT